MPAFVVDSAALSRNIEKLRRFTAAQIIAVVKGNGYGLGLVPYARFLTAQGVALLAVSTAAEAAALRAAGITAELLMLSSTALPEEIAALLARDVILTVGSADAARAVSDAAVARGVTARVHVKLDTGMGRYGFLPQETAEAAALLQALPALRVEGVFTHLSDAANAKCTALQYRRFTEGVRILQEAGIDTGLRHVCASTAFLRYPEMHLDAVRLGSALLGRLSVPDTLGLERIGWLEAQVTELKTLPAGWPVGYTGAYCTRRETRLALLPVGYTSGVGVTEETNALRLRFFKPSIQEAAPAAKSGPVNPENGSAVPELKGDIKPMEKKVTIEGMMCQHCVSHVNSALRAVPGVQDVTVSLENKNAVVSIDASVTDEALRKAVTDADYEVVSIQ